MYIYILYIYVYKDIYICGYTLYNGSIQVKPECSMYIYKDTIYTYM